MMIFFNPADVEIRNLLMDCGLDPDCYVPEENKLGLIRDCDVEPALFEFLSRTAQLADTSPQDHRYYISGIEAWKGRGHLLHHDARAIQALFRPHVGPDGLVATTILKHMLYDDNATAESDPAVREETHSYADFVAQGFTPDNLEGVFFSEQRMPKSWQKWGQSVVRFAHPNGDSGSGVIVSKVGHVLTAHHVLFDENNEFVPGQSLQFEGRSYPITPKNIAAADQASDQLLLKIPDLARVKNLPAAALAKTPLAESDQAVAVGFTGFGENEKARFYTFGNAATLVRSASESGDAPKDKAPQDLALPPLLTAFHTPSVLRPKSLAKAEAPSLLRTEARVHPGQSGGALFNDRGELVGILVARAWDQVEVETDVGGVRLEARFSNHSFSYSLVPGQIEEGPVKEMLSIVSVSETKEKQRHPWRLKFRSQKTS